MIDGPEVVTLATGVDDAERFLAGHELALAVFGAVYDIVRQRGPTEVRVSTEPGRTVATTRLRLRLAARRYLAHPGADVVLSIALGREVSSPRFKAVAHPARTQWMHHLEIHELAEVDAEVADWLREAARPRR